MNEAEIVTFKSLPLYFEKEKDGRKCNTIRECDDIYDKRFELLKTWHITGNYGKIRIVNSVTGENFVRQITDVMLWKRDWIISWKHGEILGGK